jgi:hypothetical protein
VGLNFVQAAIQCTQQGAVVFNGERPALEQHMAIGTQARRSRVFS